MEGSEDVRRSLEELLASQRFAVLCTQSDSGPHGSLVAFWAAADLRHLVFATMRATRKFAQISADPRVALVVDDRTNSEADVREAMAVTAAGRAAEAAPERAGALAAAFLARHPQLGSFVASPGCVLVEVAIDTYHVVTRFQNVVDMPAARTEASG